MAGGVSPTQTTWRQNMEPEKGKSKKESLSRDGKRKQYWLKQLKSGKRNSQQSDSTPVVRPVATSCNDDSAECKTEDSNKRYILFVGNLPYSVTKDDVLEHFVKKGLRVIEVRMLTKKGTDEPKGCCFIELQNFKHQQIALKFHQSKFKGRRINIEVTCGGGGTGEKRRQKIKQKNEKFLENFKMRKFAK